MDGSLLRSLTHRNFRLFFGGQTISLIGTWMQQVAMQWLVYELVPEKELKAWWLGVVSFAALAPAFFLAPVAGVLVDRWNRHRLIILTQTFAMIQALMLAALTLTGVVEIWHVVVLGVFLGMVNVFDVTGRQAFLVEMLDRREDLSNAIALNSSMFNGARLIGPALAGIVLAWTGAGICFLANGISYIAVLIALLAMRVQPRPRPATPREESSGLRYLFQVAGEILHGLREGFRYVVGFAPIRSILLLLTVISLASSTYSTLLPVFATDVLHGEERVFGWLYAAGGVGALAGAISLAARKSVVGLGKWLIMMPVLFGLGLVGLGLSENLVFSLVLLMVIGFAAMVHLAASNTILQTIVDEDKRGRVMSFYALAFMGTMPIGSLLTGWLGGPHVLGAPLTVAAGGGCAIAGGLLFALQLPRLKRIVRPIYVRLGILPEMAAGMQAATSLAQVTRHE